MAQDRNAELGDILRAEYGKDKPQDLHIEYFYLRLGKEIEHRKNDIIVELQTKGLLWNNLETEWPEFVVGKFGKIHKLESEREREERLNQQIRIPLLESLYHETPLPGPAIIISRVCKYTDSVTANLTTSDIEKALSACANPLNQHLDNFYLTVKTAYLQDQVKAPLTQKLSEFPGGWKMLEPEQTWPLTFIGCIPKRPFETEREREWRINEEIRIPLKKHLHDELKTYGIPEDKKLVIVLFSRAFKYTNM